MPRWERPRTQSVALYHPSTTPLASTVSAACQASTAPQTMPWTHPTPAAVSGVPLGGHPGDRDGQEQGLPRQGLSQGLQLPAALTPLGVLATALIPLPRLA